MTCKVSTDITCEIAPDMTSQVGTEIPLHPNATEAGGGGRGLRGGGAAGATGCGVGATGAVLGTGPQSAQPQRAQAMATLHR